jgi:tRNA uridine 5-carbamoylmethylation protein Kti12
MTKEELIALSDLNREDNIKYISSEAQGIAITLDSDRYAPTLCKLERAYICGRRKSEEKISELEKRCANYEMNISKMEKGTCDICKETEKDKKILDLEKENAELRKDKKELCHSISEGGKACVYLNEQLTKAKFLLKQFYEHYKAKTIYVENMGVLIAEAEQFLNSEVEK